jgi:type II secretory pathway component PulF
MIFRYKAISGSGSEVAGSGEFADVMAAEEHVRSQDLALIELRPDYLRTLTRSRRRPQLKMQSLIDFFSYLSSLMGMGLDMMTSLRTIAESLPDPRVIDTANQIAVSIDKGFSLSESMVQAGVFPKMAIASIQSAEVAGQLEGVSMQLSNHYREMKALTDNAKKAAMYPLISLVVLSGICSMLLVIVVPELKEMFPQDIPFPTRVMVAASDFLLGYWWSIPLLVVLLWQGKRRIPKHAATQLAVHFYKLPVAGRLAKELALANLFMNLAMLTSGGVAILQAMETAATSSGSELLAGKLRRARQQVELGMGLGDAFADPFFPAMVPKAVKQGERTGMLDKYFDKLAAFLKDRVNARITFLSTFIEPVITLVGGGMIMMVSLAIFLPIYGQLDSLGK